MKMLFSILLFTFFSCNKQVTLEHNIWDLAESGPVSAGEDKLLKKSETILRGDSSNIQPTTEFQWTQVFGPKAVVIENPSSLETKVYDLTAGKYVFILNRTDGSETLSDTVTITVTM